MRTPRALAAAAVGLAALTAIISTAPAYASTRAAAPAPSPEAAAKKIVVYYDINYDNFSLGHGAIRSNTIPSRDCKPLTENGKMPTKKVWQDLVKKNNTNPSPFVLDCENLSLTGTSGTVKQYDQISQLQAWTREVAPAGQVIGWYPYAATATDNASQEAYRKLIAQDKNTAFFPGIYNSTMSGVTDAQWLDTLKTRYKNTKAIDPTIPVYFYLSPQWLGGVPNHPRESWVTAQRWNFEMQSVLDSGADGFVIWGKTWFCEGDCVKGEKGPWFAATQAFLDKHVKQG
jgi:hypothetical protein